MEMPLVSVIIPTYRSNETLKRAIDSVINQDYPAIEVIVVDDNDPSSDYRRVTESIMTDYNNDSRVKYIKHPYNMNGAAARNTGFKNSKGKYICLLDDDDIFLQKKILQQVIYMEKEKEYGAAYCWRIEKGRIISSNKVGDLSSEILSLDYTPCTCSLIIRRECYSSLGGFDERYRRHQDFEFLLRFFEHYSIGVVNEPLIELSTNGVDNEPHGTKLDELKNTFFSQFEQKINEIDQRSKGFKDRVYAKHYAMVFKDHLRHRHVILASKVALSLNQKIGFTFWIDVYKLFKGITKKRIKIFFSR
jgi:glycosyltransferase involved in cell wall biosynthesis